MRVKAVVIIRRYELERYLGLLVDRGKDMVGKGDLSRPIGNFVEYRPGADKSLLL